MSIRLRTPWKFTTATSKRNMMKTLTSSTMLCEIVTRVTLVIIFCITEYSEPFHRKIQAEEWWLYKNPRTDSYVPTYILWPLVLFGPTLVAGLVYMCEKNGTDFQEAILGATLSISLDGVITNFIKIAVGRPRPDFFYRCFPDGQFTDDMKCTGDAKVIRDGLKSFPSGHSSLSFSTLGFISFYLMGKLHPFNSSGRGQAWRLLLSLAPMVTAMMIALSRTCDYHHHWQDVLVGSCLGLCIAYVCYRQYYPALDRTDSHLPLAALSAEDQNKVTTPDVHHLRMQLPWAAHPPPSKQIAPVELV